MYGVENIYSFLVKTLACNRFNIIALYSKVACEEAKKLLASNNYIEGSNSSIRNGILEEFEYVETRLKE